jgi:hypothetical protein
MSKLQQRLAGLIVLTIVSAVSILAGGVLLGGASADDGDGDGPMSGALKLAPANATFITAGADGKGASCVISFAGVAEGANEDVLVKPFGVGVGGVAGDPIRVEQGAFVEAGGDLKTFRIVNGELVEGELPEGGLPEGGPKFFAKAVEAKPISPEEIERQKASGELSSFAPGDCTIVNAEGMPEGFVPGTRSAAPFTFELKKGD